MGQGDEAVVSSLLADCMSELMSRSVEDVAKMLAVGLDLPEATFTSAGKYGSVVEFPK